MFCVDSAGMRWTAANTVCDNWIMSRTWGCTWRRLGSVWCSCTKQLEHSPVHYEQYWRYRSQVHFILSLSFDTLPCEWP